MSHYIPLPCKLQSKHGFQDPFPLDPLTSEWGSSLQENSSNCSWSAQIQWLWDPDNNHHVFRTQDSDPKMTGLTLALKDWCRFQVPLTPWLPLGHLQPLPLPCNPGSWSGLSAHQVLNFSQLQKILPEMYMNVSLLGTLKTWVVFVLLATNASVWFPRTCVVLKCFGGQEWLAFRSQWRSSPFMPCVYLSLWDLAGFTLGRALLAQGQRSHLWALSATSLHLSLITVLIHKNY